MSLTEQEQAHLTELRGQLKTLQSNIARLEEKDTHWKAKQKRERERRKMDAAGTPAHRVAQLLAKFQKRTISDDKQLQWAVDFYEMIETLGELRIAALIRYVFTAQNKYWQSRITTPNLLEANLSTIITQHEEWVQHGAPVSAYEELSMVDIPSAAVFAATKKLKAPATPTHEDNVRVQWLCQKHSEVEVCSIVDFMQSDTFWFDKMSIAMLVAKYDILKTQMEKKSMQHPKVAAEISRWGGSGLIATPRGEV